MEKQFNGIVKSEGLKDLTLDIIENIIDNQISNEVIKEIPILKSVVVIKNIYTSYTDKIFLKKALHTLLEIKDVNWKQRMDFINELKERSVSGAEKILMAIDRLETIDKCRVYGKLCRLKALKKINLQDFYKLTELIQDAYLDDLRDIYFFPRERASISVYNKEKIIIKKTDDIDKNRLITIGILLKKPFNKKDLKDFPIDEYDDELIKYKYMPSKLGELLLKYFDELLYIRI